jgi:hypothetical protein
MNDAFALGFALFVSILAIFAGRLTRRFGIPGASLLAALLVGVLLGPSVMGRVAPSVFDSVWIGDATAIEELQRLESEQGAVEHLLREQALEPGASETRAAELAEREREWKTQQAEIREQHHGAPRWFLLTSALLIIGVACLRRSGTAPGNALFGAWIAVIGVAAGLLIDRFADAPDPATTPFWIGAAAAVTWCSGWTGRGSRSALLAPARFATLYALIILAVLTAAKGDLENAAWPALALLVTALGSRFILLDDPRSAARLEWLTRRILAPAIVAVSLLQIDLVADLRQLWVPVLLWLAMSDLRWLVATSVIRFQGKSWVRASIAALPLMGTGSLAIAIGGIALWTKQVDEVAAIWIFLAGAVAELEGDSRGMTARALANLRRRTAHSAKN